MQCAVCGTGDELLYTCGRCGEPLCATHHGRSYHRCVPDPAGDWTPPGSRNPTTGGGMALADHADHADTATSLDRPRSRGSPDPTADADKPHAESHGEPVAAEGHADSPDAGRVATDVAGSATEPTGEGGSTPALPLDATRPGYGPDSPHPDPVEPADSLGEWFRRQTYVSLSLKVGFVATLCSAFVFSSLVVALSLVGA